MDSVQHLKEIHKMRSVLWLKKGHKNIKNIQANLVLFLKKLYANNEHIWWQNGAVPIEKARKR
jgi:hypothetical protein